MSSIKFDSSITSNGLDIQLLRQRLHLSGTKNEGQVSTAIPLGIASISDTDTATQTANSIKQNLRQLAEASSADKPEENTKANKDSAVTEKDTINISTEAMWQNALAEIRKSKTEDTQRLDDNSKKSQEKQILDTPESLEDMAMAYQFVRSKYAGRYNEAELNMVYRQSAVDMARNTTANFSKVFDPQFQVLGTYDPKPGITPNYVASPYQKELSKINFDNKNFYNRLLQFSEEALKSVKSSSINASLGQIRAKVDSSLSAIQSDSANINELSFNTMKILEKTVQSLSDLTKFTETDAKTAKKVVNEWNCAIKELVKNAPDLSTSIANFLTSELEVFKKTWSFVAVNTDNIANREKLKKELEEKEKQYKQMQDLNGKYAPLTEKDNINRAKSLIKLQTAIKSLNKQLKYINKTIQSINASPESVINSAQYQTLSL